MMMNGMTADEMELQEMAEHMWEETQEQLKTVSALASAGLTLQEAAALVEQSLSWDCDECPLRDACEACESSDCMTALTAAARKGKLRHVSAVGVDASMLRRTVEALVAAMDSCEDCPLCGRCSRSGEGVSGECVGDVEEAMETAQNL